MLVLSRKVGEKIVIAGDIGVTVVALQGNRVRLGITAPASARVDRAEVHQRLPEAGSPRPSASQPRLPESGPPRPGASHPSRRTLHAKRTAR
jgi:carbon storage regulator